MSLNFTTYEQYNKDQNKNLHKNAETEDNAKSISLESAQLIRKHVLKKMARYESLVKETAENNGDPFVYVEKLKKLYDEFQKYHSIAFDIISSSSERHRPVRGAEQELLFKNIAMDQFRRKARDSFPAEEAMSQDFKRVAKGILSSNPRITLKMFAEGYNAVAKRRINFLEMREEELRELFESISGVVLQPNQLNNSYNVLDLNVVCFPFKQNSVCECGLDCDGANGELALGWRTMQCAAELFGKCRMKANCNYLHTKTPYKN
ncbi:hypothetical protein MHBO_002317 [Bonamia ostreae]|uniref:C3H1-type domain-containing protein n=1 Tax=Bonamia ostreae TaxID=126728 RepID=A0ABV2ALX9_9EUKA